MRVRLLLSVLVSALLWVGCQSGGSGADPAAETGPSYDLENRADTLAMELYEELGGPEAWASLPYLRFTFAVERSGERTPVAHHFWDRTSGRYRVEWNSQNDDTTFVALFDVDAHEGGSVYANGSAVDTARADALLDQAYRRYINDTYWLLAPVKLLDPGVDLETVPDSTTAEELVLHATFEDVGLTPGDQYWYTVDRESGRMSQWAYHLQSYEPDQPPSRFQWTGYQSFEAPAGTIWMATRKQAIDGNTAILTDQIATLEEAPDEIFSDPSPRL